MQIRYLVCLLYLGNSMSGIILTIVATCSITFVANTAIIGLDLPKRVLTFCDASGNHHQEQFDLLLGTDGINSFVRAAMQQGDKHMEVDRVPNLRLYSSFRNLPPMGTPASYRACMHKAFT